MFNYIALKKRQFLWKKSKESDYDGVKRVNLLTYQVAVLQQILVHIPEGREEYSVMNGKSVISKATDEHILVVPLLEKKKKKKKKKKMNRRVASTNLKVN